MFEVELPSGKKVQFKEPVFELRQELLSNYAGVKETGYLFEELYASACLHSENGEVYPNEHPITRFKKWSNKDQQYYVELFAAMFYPDEEEKKRVTTLAKKLLSGTTSTEVTPVKPTKV